MKVILIGYMGSGKSTIGKMLANKLNTKFIDLDHYIEAKEDMSVSELFKKKGEIYFRKKETLYLKEVLSLSSPMILALGGGTPCIGNNIDIINSSENATSIYLNTALQVLTNRLYIEKDKRPLISHVNSEERLEDFIRKHLFERSFYYNQAMIKIKTDHKNENKIVDEIYSLLQERHVF